MPSPKEPTTILAIETSCDETGVAVVQSRGECVHVLAADVASQIDTHRLTGGVVPEIAAREHVSIIQPLIKQVLTTSNTKGQNLDAIAVTIGPGLQPALSVGVTAAQALGFAWNKPIIPVHHIEGHIYSALLLANSKTANKYQMPSPNPFPALALIVSGGHTALIKISGHLQYKVLGATRDDAAGEAFDKIARLLGLPYPGGPAISLEASKGNPSAFQFSRPMLKSGDLDFSFSGLKTDVLYTLRDLDKKGVAYNKADVAASFQQAVVETLVTKTKTAAKVTNPASILLAGGVAANESLRRQMQLMAKQIHIPLQIAPQELCGDNAVMIGMVAGYALKAGRIKKWHQIDAHSRLNIGNL